MVTRVDVARGCVTALRWTGIAKIARPLAQGAGVIFVAHHVQPGPQPPFAPNAQLTITPEFLESVVELVLSLGYEVIRLDEVPSRLASGYNAARRFACFTFDDGYRDNREHALPIFERHNLPLSIFIVADYAEGKGDMWWEALEEALGRLDIVSEEWATGVTRRPLLRPSEKLAAAKDLFRKVHELPESTLRQLISRLCNTAEYDPTALTGKLTMSWSELRELARHPLITIGAHSVGHWSLARLATHEARSEIFESKYRLEQNLGMPCQHFAFPYGGPANAGVREFRLAKQAGFATALTTRARLVNGVKDDLMALPRISLNGELQCVDHVKTLLSGVPSALLGSWVR
jgi:peptidoglycan/xylan/chitin deacetylase (PgdA/CDA1 family)